MIPANGIVVPEMQHYFRKFLSTCQLNKNTIPSPLTLKNNDMSDNSVIRLLFDDNWPINLLSYNYLYRQINDLSVWPRLILSRAKIYQNSKYYISDGNIECNLNLLNLTSENLILIDSLLVFRTHQILEIYDSPLTSIPTLIQISQGVYDLFVNYLSLDDLSKLIFLYLFLQKYEDLSLPYFNNQILISQLDNLLNSLYEVYVTEKYFRFVSDKKFTDY